VPGEVSNIARRGLRGSLGVARGNGLVPSAFVVGLKFAKRVKGLDFLGSGGRVGHSRLATIGTAEWFSTSGNRMLE